MLGDKMRKTTSGIYQILNTINGKIYIGSAVKLSARKSEHLRDLRRNCHQNPRLQHSFNIHGEQAFKFSVLEYVEDKSKLLEREQYYIDTMNACNKSIGYNICKKAGSAFGRPCQQKTKDAISKANKGKKRTDDFRKECAERASGINNPFYGKHRAEETRKKIGDALRGRKRAPLSEEHKRKVSESNKGKHSIPCSDTKKINISIGLKQYYENHNCANSVKVKNIDTGKIYNSIADAEKELNLPLRHSHISDVCAGKRHKAGGYRWEYYTN